jgi:hypothetical protein
MTALRDTAIKLLFAGYCICSGCKTKEPPALPANDIGRVTKLMSATMIHDVTNPPLAARFFAYACLTGYEIVSENDTSIPRLQGRLNAWPVITRPASLTGYDTRLSSVLGMMETAAKLQPSGYLISQQEEHYLDSCRRIGFGEAVIDSSLRYARLISSAILAYARGDRYNRISNYTRYTPPDKPGSWVPTPPAYMSPVEPYFNTIRPFTLDSASQFVPEPPVPFSTDKHSTFYQYAWLVYTQGGNQLTPAHRDIANFWDCNPFAVENNGHMMIGLKKISPGAHWMGITSIACQKANTGFAKTMEINMAEAITLMDAFMCCWDDKYRTNRIRPETAIRKYIDPSWRPILQTPPFPEYISGHSVVSAASATILTYFLGDHFSYTDNVEQDYHIPPRSFTSFSQAAQEAAISRFWGGIHFKDAIDKGLIQGDLVGQWVIKKIK